MDKRLSNKLTMIEGVHAYLTDHENKFSSNTGMVNTKERLLLKIGDIYDREAQRVNVRKGKMEAKETYRDHMITQGLSFSSKLFDLGNLNKNIELSAQSDFNRSALNKQRDRELLGTLEVIKENAEANIESLSVYDITPEKLQSFATMISIYRSRIESKQTSEALKSSARKTLSVLFKEANLILKSLDKMMEEFHDSEVQFYAGYKTARNIKDLGIRYRPDTQGQPIGEAGGNGENGAIGENGAREQRERREQRASENYGDGTGKCESKCKQR
ncbi:MAG: hypothetical protein IPM38_13805 [Ignavibacteria bacterium]|nr:hypothetical protein [Ignavibacteria bacterium]